MLERARSGAAREGDWLVAERQTAGRGRSGRAWISTPGNLYSTGLVRLRASDPAAPTLALMAGVAAQSAMSWADDEGSGITLKWPNDLLVGGEKIGGILLEREGDFVAIGIGLNLAHAPALAERAATSLAAMGRVLNADEAMAMLTVAVARWLDIWRRQGIEPIRAAWLARAHPVGAPLSAALPDGTRIDGNFDGLTEDCALRLRLADGSSRVIHAGDVFLGLGH